MVSTKHVAYKAEDRSYFAITKKEIHALAVSGGLSENKVAEVDIIVAEMVSNLVKHAGGGHLLVKLIEQDGLQGIEILSIDSGGGIGDVTRMVADGVSTKGTLGHGLGAMKRLSDTFQVYSQKGWGTIILARVFQDELPYKKPSKIEIRTVVLPKPGETECGDGYYFITNENNLKLFLGDGLGHGPDAAKAVTLAIEAFQKTEENDPAEIIRYINGAVKKTRGLVATVAVFDFHHKSWKFCGVGNISTKVNGPSFAKNYTPYNGIVGLNLPNTLNAADIPYEKGQHVIMCSDGLKSRWDTLRYPSILRYDLTILSASLVKDFARNTDDLSVMACKINL